MSVPVSELSPQLIQAYEGATVIVLTGGLALNLLLLLMFILQKEIRITSNLMMFNLALSTVIYNIATMCYFINDYIMEQREVISNKKYFIPHFFIDSYYSMVIAASAIQYSAQRYAAISGIVKPPSRLLYVPRLRVLFKLSVIWSIPLLFCLFLYFLLSVFEDQVKIMYLTFFGITAFITMIAMPLYVSVYGVLARRKLRIARRMVQEPTSKSAITLGRYMDSRLITDLTIALIASYPWMVVVAIADFLDLESPIIPHVIRFAVFLYYCRSICIPVTLYKGSPVFENLFNKYFLRCLYKPESIQSIERRVSITARLP